MQSRSRGEGSVPDNFANMMPAGAEVAFETRTAESLRWFEVPMLVYQLQALVAQVTHPPVLPQAPSRPQGRHFAVAFTANVLLRWRVAPSRTVVQYEAVWTPYRAMGDCFIPIPSSPPFAHVTGSSDAQSYL